MKTIEEFMQNNPFVRVKNYRHNGVRWMFHRDGKYIVCSQDSSKAEFGDKILETPDIEAALNALEGER